METKQIYQIYELLEKLDSYEIRNKICRNIKKYRLEAGITQEQLALDIGKSYDFTRRLEFKKGEIGCSIDTLYKISVVLNTRIDKFFE